MKLNLTLLAFLTASLAACSQGIEYTSSNKQGASPVNSADSVGSVDEAPIVEEPEVVEEAAEEEEEAAETPEVVVEDPNALPTQADVLQMPAFTLRVAQNTADDDLGLRYTKPINDSIEPSTLVMPDTLTLVMGQVLNVCNDGDENIRIHTGGRPFPHGANIAPGTCTEYTINTNQPTLFDGQVYDHNLGSGSGNDFKMNIVDQAGADAIIAQAAM